MGKLAGDGAPAEGAGATKWYDSFLALSNWLTVKASGLGAIGVIIMCLITTYEVIMRYIFNRPTIWSLEMGTYLLALAVFGSLAAALMEEEHVRALFVLSHLRPKVQQIARVIATVPAIGVVLLFLWQSSVALIKTYQVHEVSMTPLQTPQWLPQALLPLGLFLFLLQWIVKMTEYIRALGTDQIRWEKPKQKAGKLTVTDL